jgi:S-adenosylmethionine:tRNA-ribosyltransferase-isomerase (queuine synthetase)
MSSSTREFTLSDFDFDLPESLIAQHPTAVRSASRLLDGRSLPATDRIFRELPDLLQPGDLLVFNDTKVIRRASSAKRPAAARSSCWSSACCRTTRSWPICA